MANQRSVALLVMAILHFVGGAYGILASCCGAIGIGFLAGVGSAASKASDPAMELFSAYWQALTTNIPGFLAFSIAQIVLDLILSVTLIVAGIGLLQAKKWAWVASLAYAGSAIIIAMALGGYQFAVVNPGMQKAQTDVERFMATKLKVPPGAQRPANPFDNPMMSAGTSAVGVFIRLIYPVAVIVVMLLPAVRAAVGRQSPSDRYREEVDEHFERDRDLY